MNSGCSLLHRALLTVAILSFFVCHVQPITTIEVRIGVILDLTSPLGKMSMVSIELGILEYNTRDPNSRARLILLTRDSKGEVTVATSAASDLLFKEKVHLVIGPQSTDEAIYVAALALSAGIPVLSFSATSPFLSISNFPSFVRTALSDTSQIQAIADLIKSYRSKGVIIIHENTPAYAAIIPDIIDVAGTDFAHRFPIESTTSNESIRANLISLDKTLSYIFVVHTSFHLCTRLFDIARSASMMHINNVWVATDVIGNLFETAMDLAGLSSMKGILAIRQHFVCSKGMQQFEQKWRLKYLKQHSTSDIFQPTAYDIRAYETVRIITMAVDQVVELNNLSIIDGKNLLKSILRTNFDGLGGQVAIRNGGLQSRKVFEISEVVDEKWIELALWEDGKGIKWWRSKAESASPVTPKRLKVVVPKFVDPGCARLLKVEINNGEIEVEGFLKDVFKAAMDELPYKVDYDFVLFVDDEGHRGGTYNDIVRHIKLKKYDVSIIDLSITHERMSDVQFTLPILSTTISMIFKKADKVEISPWFIFEPWTLGLWFATVAVVVFMGIAIWYLEYEARDIFRGPVPHNVAVYFAFMLPILGSTDVGGLAGDLSKLLFWLWNCVALILKSTYEAQLSTMFSAVQLECSTSMLHDLIRNGDRVGYYGSIQNVLLRLGFQKDQLKPYKSLAELASALDRGSKDGVLAIFGESPYMDLLHQKSSDNNCLTRYESLKLGGIGYVFQKELNILYSDFSRAILRLTEEGKITELERKWLNHRPTSQSSASSTDSAIGLQSTWVLILVAVLITVIILFFSQLPRVRRFIQAFRDIIRHGFIFYEVRRFSLLISCLYQYHSRLPRMRFGI